MSRKLSPWKALVAICYSLIFGIYISNFNISANHLGLVMGVIFILLIQRKNKVQTLLFIIVCLGVLTGYMRGSNIKDSAYEVYKNIGKSAEFEGVLFDSPTINNNGFKSLVVKDLKLNNKNIPGKILVQSDSAIEMKRGDTITFDGQISNGIGGYLATMYRAKISSVARTSDFDRSLKIREWFSKRIKKVMPQTQASLGLGFLVGDKNSLPEDLTLDLRLTGLSHIVVASGYNLTILVFLARYLFARISRYTACIGGITLAISFMYVAGSNPSMSRATLVSILTLIAWYFGKKFKPSLLIGIVALITSFINPYYVWGDPGWYLSFLAFIGVLVFAPLIDSYLFYDIKRTNPLRSAFIESLSAILLTLPYSVYIFGQASLVALIANMAVTPLIPFIMLFTFMAGIFHGFPLIGDIIGFIAKSGIDFAIYLINIFARRDPGFEITNVSIWFIVIAYFILVLLYLYLRKTNSKNIFIAGNLPLTSG